MQLTRKTRTSDLLSRSQGAYRGTVEVSRDVTEIRALQGERRLLDEEERP